MAMCDLEKQLATEAPQTKIINYLSQWILYGCPGGHTMRWDHNIVQMDKNSLLCDDIDATIAMCSALSNHHDAQCDGSVAMWQLWCDGFKVTLMVGNVTNRDTRQHTTIYTITSHVDQAFYVEIGIFYMYIE